jgi:hypothetical protein
VSNGVANPVTLRITANVASLHIIVKTITKGDGITADVATGGVHMITINVIENEPVIGYGYISNKRGINVTGHFHLLFW